jgi:hypothetical protein
VRVVLAVGFGLLLVLVGVKVLGRAAGVAGSNRVAPAVFAVSLPRGGLLCQGVAPLPADAAGVAITIGSYDAPFPATRVRFLADTGAVSAAGQIPAGAPAGPTSIPLERPRDAPAASRLCLRFAGHTHVVVAGGATTPGPGSAQVDGRPQPGVVGLTYYRRPGESWWSLLPTLVERFGRGKAAFFGDWTLPACGLAIVAVWILAARLLAREL